MDGVGEMLDFGPGQEDGGGTEVPRMSAHLYLFREGADSAAPWSTVSAQSLCCEEYYW